ncbi:MAG: NAD(P)-binding protein [Alphaproteobacteria bacterium]|nr:NAD(P)-binding protein [Alphaproteobacteria bacterium]
MEAAKPALAFNPAQLRAKYRAERDKRLREDGNAQYREVVGEFKHYVDDPYVEPGFTRAPLNDEVDVIIIGGGFGGLLAGARLREAGVKDIRIIEKGGDFGGTWYWNRYPGAACDIEAYVYLPLLEETGYMPKRKFTPALEILEHSRRIARHYDLYDNACLQTEIRELRWDEASSRWIVKTNRNDEMKARFVVMSNGPLNRPKLPGIEGIGTYKGHTFHTSRWDYAYTGGNAEGNLSKLADKRVAVIGTGATAVQCVPHLGAAAKELFVFQRTPSSIDVRNDRETDPEWAKSLEPGWHQKRMDNFNILTSGGIVAEDLVKDGWTEIIRNILLLAQQPEYKDMSPAKLAEMVEIADFQKMEKVRARVDQVVKDKATAESLKPWYRQFCKRPCFHDEYLETFNRPNVHLIDTDGKGVDRITERGVVANGVEYEVDCIIFATGFEVGTGYTRRSGYDLFGRGGQRLSDVWQDGVRTMHGLFVHGFPNVFVMAGPQAAFTANYPHMLDEHSKHIAHIVDRALSEQIRTLEVKPEAVDEWVKTIIAKAQMRLRFLEECTPGYYNNEGKPNARSAQDGFYGGGPVEYFGVLKAWREKGDMPGLALKKA